MIVHPGNDGDQDLPEEEPCPLCNSDRVFTLKELERFGIDRAMKAANNNVDKAAKLLGIGRATLYRRLAEIRRAQEEEDQSVVTLEEE